MEKEIVETKSQIPIKRDIRRYSCDYCGIVRSKKTIIASHIQSHHQDEMKEKKVDEKGEKTNVCAECGVSFRKPAYLKQHMQNHSFERPFMCCVQDCNSSYRRKDHLARHLLKHEGRLFDCPIENCNKKFSFRGNMTRHVREIHADVGSTSDDMDIQSQKQYACKEPGCGKVFQYASKLAKHEDSHVRLKTVEAFCAEPGCMKLFTNEECLKDHLHSCHQHIICEICGCKQLKKNIKRHIRTHSKMVMKERIKCSFDKCHLTFSTSSNLRQHVKSFHFHQKPYVCSVAGCGMKFSFKHVRDKHEKSGCHVYTLGDFVKSDEQFQSRDRGGRKRKLPAMIETLMKKRVHVHPPTESDLMQGVDYISWFHSAADDED